MSDLGMFPERLFSHKILKSEEIADLVYKAQAGDVPARNRIVEHNMRLVLKIAQKYAYWEVPLEDMIQEGSIALLRAIETFDPAKGYRFSTYATWWIQCMLGRLMYREWSVVKLPSSSASKHKVTFSVPQAMRAPRLLAAEDETGVPRRKKREDCPRPRDFRLDAKFDSAKTRTFAEDSGGDTPVSFSDLIRYPQNAEGVCIQKIWDRTILEQFFESSKRLRPIQREILVHRYLKDEETLATIGERLGITRERVRQIEVEALKRLALDERLQRIAEDRI